MAKPGTILRPLNIGKKDVFSKYDKLRLPKYKYYNLDKTKYVITKSGALRNTTKSNTARTNVIERI